ncbi:MAG: diguanylate cyclase, partial [Alphaproteobacteria bacterium]
VMQMGWGELVHPDDQEASRETAARLRAGETSLASTFRYRCKSGDTLWVEARLNFVPATDDDQAQYVVNIRDVSERKHVEEQLAASNRELELQARTDGLTGIANRRRFDEALDEEWRRGARSETPLSVLMIDVDRFKLFNDRYGHGAGDVCLAQVAQAISKCVHRPGDLVARYGGEEISLVLPQTGAAGALEIAETIRATVQGLHIAHQGNTPVGVVTVSIGAATRFPRFVDNEKAGGALELTALADRALYQAKRTGRNRVNGESDVPNCMSPPLPPDETGRLAAVVSYGLGGKPASMDSLDRLARLTSALFHTPIGMVSLIGSERQCYIGRAGLDAPGIAREISFCAHAIAGEGVFTVADAAADDRFSCNPLVTGEPNIRFYAGAPLVGVGGHHLGALCIIDH